jgi:type II secretory pathway pseudopilin PulG
VKNGSQKTRGGIGGFTLVEVLIASGISVVVLTVALSVFISCLRSWKGIQMRMDADQEVNAAMSHLLYGANQRLGLRSAATVTLSGNASAWSLAYATGGVTPQNNCFTYSASTSNLVFTPGPVVVGQDLSAAQISLIGTRSLAVTLTVSRAESALAVKRTIGTTITWRN